MMTNRSFPLTLQCFLLFLTSHLTAYPHRFLKIQMQNQAKHGDWQAQKNPETKKDRFPKERFLLNFGYFEESRYENICFLLCFYSSLFWVFMI